jgi:hypothetical protein
MRTLGILATAGLVALASAAVAAGGGGPQIYAGEVEFNRFCSTCHGTEGKGDGPIAHSLRRHPPDLTQLAKRNDGVFSAEKVSKIIDGRAPLAGHGGPDMPVWGNVFAQSRESQNPEEVKARIDAIVKYLERIQEKQ